MPDLSKMQSSPKSRGQFFISKLHSKLRLTLGNCNCLKFVPNIFRYFDFYRYDHCAARYSVFTTWHGPLTRYVKLRVAHAPGMPGTFSPPPRVSDPDMHHGTCVTHVPWCITGSLTSGFLGNRWRGKRSRHSRRMRNSQFYVSGKRPMEMLSPLRMDLCYRNPTCRDLVSLFC